MMDKKTIILFLVMVLGISGYQIIVTGPKLREYQVKMAQFKKERAERDAWERAHAKQGANGGGGGVAVPNTQTVTQAPVPPTDGHAVHPRRREFLEKLASQPKTTYTLESPSIVAILSPRGASLERLTFPTIKESTFRLVESDKREPEPFTPLHPYADHARSLALEAEAAEKGLEDVEWLHEDIAESKGHRFTRVLEDGTKIVKEFTPRAEPDAFYFDLAITVENPSETARSLNYTLNGPAGMVEQNQVRSTGLQAVLATRDSHGGTNPLMTRAAEIDSKKTSRPSVQSGNGTRVLYFGLVTKYFASIVIPFDEQETITSAKALPLLELAGKTQPETPAKDAPEDATNQVAVQGVASTFAIPERASVSHHYRVYVGPRSDQILESETWNKHGLDYLIEYGWPQPLSRLLSWILRGFHAITGNWGWSIVLLTFLVRALMHPVSYKGQKSMMKMQKLGPEMTKLKEKFEDKDGKMSPAAAQQFQRETWDLYRKHGVNPVGCLGPMVLQIPVFIALYGSVNHVYELRQAPFLLWIKDLSEPDVVARLPWAIFWPHGTNAISLLPIFMMILYTVQPMMNPKPADPKAAEQQKMMQWMMPIMGYMFWLMPSGLLLYFVTSATLGMIESRWVKHRLAKVEAEWKGQPQTT